MIRWGGIYVSVDAIWEGLTIGLDVGTGFNDIFGGSLGGSITFDSSGIIGWDTHIGLTIGGFEKGGWELGGNISYGSTGCTWSANARYTQNPFAKYQEVMDMTICRIEPFGKEDLFGHYWIEIDGVSYGFWPERAVSVGEAITNSVKGEINAKYFDRDKNPTTDPHHGDNRSVVKRYKVSGTKSTAYYKNALQNYAKNYTGQYGIPFGKSCQTFQRSFMFNYGLKLIR